MQGIYKITNRINNKCYIGQSVDIKARLAHHKSDAYNEKLPKYRYPLYRAIRKYGKENFDFEVLELVEDIDLLTQRELYWYNKFDNKYNLETPTKTLSKFTREIYQLDANSGKKIASFISSKDVERKLGLDASSISKACKGKLFEIGGYLWCYAEDYATWEKPQYTRMNARVKQIDYHTREVIEVFKSAREAFEKTGIAYQNISKVCNGKRNRAGGYCWEFE